MVIAANTVTSALYYWWQAAGTTPVAQAARACRILKHRRERAALITVASGAEIAAELARDRLLSEGRDELLRALCCQERDSQAG
ncbi:MAG TPA: hypothetical protein VIY52_00220 [Streptosporangiaceae bacterium]